MRYGIEMLVRRVSAIPQHSIPSSFHLLPRFCSSSSASPSSKLFIGVRIAYDKGSGRSRGFGFVDFAEKDDALSAKHAMDGKGLFGRPLRIGFALQKVRGGPVVVQRFGKPNSDREKKVFK
ncbi:hypothetical protein HID58_019926 [Brassica napus]|uniref:RRM domain-containing protein n=1 Tax=Brassica napus TaxID=3708 RepID=A0ABQ8DGS1_BRANA|nr:hypothetical protein HID58_019926 [Brassica napus]